MTKEKYQAVLDAGCDWEPSGGQDTDDDCGHVYDWECDNCPIVIEQHKNLWKQKSACHKATDNV